MPRGHCTLLPDDTGRTWIAWRDSNRLSRPRRSAKPSRTPDGQSPELQADPPGRLLGRPGHGAVDRLADPPGLQACPPPPRRQGDPGSLQPLRSPARLGIAPMRHLFEHVVRPLARPETPGAFSRGLRLMGIDGTVLDVPDSDANAAAFGRPSAGRAAMGPSPRSASSAWSSWGLMSRSPSWPDRSPMANSRWSGPCSAISAPTCSCCGIAASSAMPSGRR